MRKEPSEVLGENCRRIIDAERLTHTEFASRIGLHGPAAATIINGRSKNPTLRTISRIAEAFGKDVLWMLTDHTPGAAQQKAAAKPGSPARGLSPGVDSKAEFLRQIVEIASVFARPGQRATSEGDFLQLLTGKRTTISWNDLERLREESRAYRNQAIQALVPPEQREETTERSRQKLREILEGMGVKMAKLTLPARPEVEGLIQTILGYARELEDAQELEYVREILAAALNVRRQRRGELPVPGFELGARVLGPTGGQRKEQPLERYDGLTIDEMLAGSIPPESKAMLAKIPAAAWRKRMPALLRAVLYGPNLDRLLELITRLRPEHMPVAEAALSGVIGGALDDPATDREDPDGGAGEDNRG